MKALVWHATNDVRVERVPDPTILNGRDAIIKITTTAICGSDLHLLDGYIPTMQAGDILGHEFMGEVVEVGKDNKKLKIGDRVVVPFTIACGACFFCNKQLWSLCDNSNPNAWMAEKIYGYTTSGLFGYSHMTGGYAGGQAQYARVPFADVGPLKIPDGLRDEQVLFLSDIFPTGYMAAENCDIQRGDTIAVWGCGPVGQMAIRSAFLLGAERVIAIDDVPERLRLAADGGAEVLNFEDGEVFDRLQIDDRRPRPGRVHRCRRHGSARPDARCVHRSGENGGVSRHRPSERTAAGDPRVPQGRHRFDSGRLRRLPRQDPVRRRVPEGADLQDGADAHDEVHAAAAATASSAARSIRHSSSRIACRSTTRRRATRCSATKGPVHQGRAQAARRNGALIFGECRNW